MGDELNQALAALEEHNEEGHRRRYRSDEHQRGYLSACPANLFYGTGIPACLLVINRKKSKNLEDKILFHGSRTHLALAKDAPQSRAIMSEGKIIAIPQVGGLHHRYERHMA